MVSTPAPEAALIRAQVAEPTQAPAVVHTLGQEVGLIPDQVADCIRGLVVVLIQDQVAVHIPGRAAVLRRRRVAGATAGLAVVALSLIHI